MKDMIRTILKPVILPTKTYCSVIAYTIHKFVNSITDDVTFKTKKDHYTSDGYYVELEDDNTVYEITIKTRSK